MSRDFRLAPPRRADNGRRYILLGGTLVVLGMAGFLAATFRGVTLPTHADVDSMEPHLVEDAGSPPDGADQERAGTTADAGPVMERTAEPPVVSWEACIEQWTASRYERLGHTSESRAELKKRVGETGAPSLYQTLCGALTSGETNPILRLNGILDPSAADAPRRAQAAIDAARDECAGVRDYCLGRASRQEPEPVWLRVPANISSQNPLPYLGPVADCVDWVRQTDEAKDGANRKRVWKGLVEDKGKKSWKTACMPSDDGDADTPRGDGRTRAKVVGQVRHICDLIKKACSLADGTPFGAPSPPGDDPAVHTR